MQDFLDPYAPFEEDELLQQSRSSVYEGYCQHLAYCANCGAETVIQVPSIPASTYGSLSGM